MLTDMFSSGSLRSRSRRAGCLVLFFLPFFGGALVLSGCLASNAQRVANLRDHQPRTSMAGPDGPVLLEGELVGPVGGQRLEGETETGPVVRAFEVSRREGKSRTTFCEDFLSRGVALRLAVGGEAVALGELLPEDKLRWRSGTGGKLSSGLSFDVGTIRQARGVPPRIELHCSSTFSARRLRSPELAALRFDERVVPEGTRVKVLACKQGERLVPCGDGLDAVLSHETSAMAFAVSKMDVDMVRFVALWNSICLTLFGWFFLGMLPRAPGQKESFRVDTREGA